MNAKDLFPAIFSRHALSYQERLDYFLARGESRARLLVIERLGLRAGDRVLDLGCGPGTLTFRIADRVGPEGEVIGIDLAEGMIELARATEPKIRTVCFLVMDAEALAFPEASFDAAACGHALQFFPDLGRALVETCRVLKPSGSFAASLPAGAMTGGADEVLSQLLDSELGTEAWPPDVGRTADLVSNANTLRDTAVAAGFAQARVEDVEERTVWPSAREMVVKSLSWWQFAARVERLDLAARERVVERAVKEVEDSAGTGPVVVGGFSRLLVAKV